MIQAGILLHKKGKINPITAEITGLVSAFDGYIVVTNDTGFDIYYLYVSHEDSEDWEEDVLRDEVLGDGEEVQIDITGYDSSNFDVSAEDEDTYTV